jgi:hypothetical protein
MCVFDCALPLIELFCCLCLPLQGLLQTQASRVLYFQRLGVSTVEKQPQSLFHGGNQDRGGKEKRQMKMKIT